MLGLVDYASDSDGERDEQQQGAAAPPPAQGRAGAAVSVGSGLPSASELLGGATGAGASRQGAAGPGGLPAPDFGQAPPRARGATGAAGGAGGTGAKRSHPDTRGPLPNPFSADSKLQRSGVAASVAAARPSSSGPGGLLLPPQLRGRANISTEDTSIFSKQSAQPAQQRSSGGSGSRGGSGGSAMQGSDGAGAGHPS